MAAAFASVRLRPFIKPTADGDDADEPTRKALPTRTEAERYAKKAILANLLYITEKAYSIYVLERDRERSISYEIELLLPSQHCCCGYEWSCGGAWWRLQMVTFFGFEKK